MNSQPCPQYETIIQKMTWAIQYQCGYTPSQTPSLTVELSNHKHTCPTCQENAAKLLQKDYLSRRRNP